MVIGAGCPDSFRNVPSIFTLYDYLLVSPF